MPPIARSRSALSASVAADRLVRRSGQLDRCVELALEPVGEHLELQLTDGREHERRVAHVGVAQHLHDALLLEHLEPAAELLRRGSCRADGRS